MRSEDEIREALEWEKKELGVWQAERQKMWEERNYRPNVHEGYFYGREIVDRNITLHNELRRKLSWVLGEEGGK